MYLHKTNVNIRKQLKKSLKDFQQYIVSWMNAFKPLINRYFNPIYTFPGSEKIFTEPS